MQVLTPPPERLATSPLREPRGRGSAGIAALGLAGFALVGSALGNSGPVLCPIRVCTGEACPGCGVTRGLASLLKGDLVGSWRYHPLAIFLAVQAIAAGLLFAVVYRSPRRKPSPDAMRNLIRVGVVVNVLAFGVVWAVRWKLGLLDQYVLV